MPHLQGLGHVGIHCHDLDLMADFYSRVLGLHIVDDQRESRGFVFLSSHPESEHHEVFLCKGRNVDESAVLLHQVSFRAPELEDVQEYVAILKREGARIEHTVTHGMALSVYFFDPEGNRCEVYWDTQVRGKRAFLKPLDLERPVDAVLADAERLIADIPPLPEPAVA